MNPNLFTSIAATMSLMLFYNKVTTQMKKNKKTQL